MCDAWELPDDKLHAGHRSRMRRKLLTYGQKIFDDYEILEMLLYYAVPYRDTNPVAKRLLMKFGSLDRVLSASAEDLARTAGIGERAARLLVTVGEMSGAMRLDGFMETGAYNDYAKAGEFFVNYFKGNKKRAVAIMLLDNGMRARGVLTLYEHVVYGSAAVMAAPFINQAVLAGAAVVITAHNRPFGPEFLVSEDIETNRMLDMAFDQVGIAVAEHYLIAGDKYLGTRDRREPPTDTETELDKFRHSREAAALREEKK